MKLTKSHQTKMLRVTLQEGRDNLYLVRLYSRRSGKCLDSKVLFDDFDARVLFAAACEFMNDNPKTMCDFWDIRAAREQKWERQNAIWRIYRKLMNEIDLDWGGATPEEEQYFWKKAEEMFDKGETA